MIELRWVMKPCVIADPFAQDVKVLQYRNGEYPYQPPHDKEWSGTDWIDVPTAQAPAPK